MKIVNIIQILKHKIKMNLLKKRGIQFGKNCYILTNYKTSFGSEPYLIKMGDNVLISAHCFLCPHDGGTWTVNNLYKTNYDRIGPIVIGNNVYIGYGCTIFGNVNIGNNVIIGSNSVVTRDIPDNSVCAGVPAKVICSIEEYKEKNMNLFDETFSFSTKDKKNYYLKKYNDQIRDERKG